MFHFYTLWIHQKTFGFLTFSRSIEMEHWFKMGQCLSHFIFTDASNKSCQNANISSKIVHIFKKIHIVSLYSFALVFSISIIWQPRSSGNHHCVKSVQIRSVFWSVFSCNQSEYENLLRKSPYSVWIQENTDQKTTPYLDTFHIVH